MTNIPYGAGLRRFKTHTDPMTRVNSLPDHHSAVIQATSRYPAKVIWAGFADRILKSGGHNRKIGAVVTKGKWAGYPIFTLTLTERATCPHTCRHWGDCYGNKMNWSDRLIVDQVLIKRLDGELRQLQKEFPDGFVVRLHVLGDFPSVEYVGIWMYWLDKYPALHVFGYTAHWETGRIGRKIRHISDVLWDRFAIRTSNRALPERAAISHYTGDKSLKTIGDAIVCPAQNGRSDCCATCGLCWNTRKNIAFLVH